jgi:thymidylate synthase
MNMHMRYRDVNDAFAGLVSMLGRGGGKAALLPLVKRDSRYGPCYEIDEPMTFTYSDPTSRVLLNKHRLCNPFFHIYEALWMLAGRKDVASVAYYNRKMTSFSDDYREDPEALPEDRVLGSLNGSAYGWRWRCARGVPELRMMKPEGRNEEVQGYYRPGVDQLKVVLEHLKREPNSRRAVVTMWNVEDDLLKINTTGECPGCDGEGSMMYQWAKEAAIKSGGKKVPCSNPKDGFYYVDGEGREISMKYQGTPSEGDFPVVELEMTVNNRSNDLVWGMLGANYVHFTVLQEYLAAKLGVKVGRYHHFTNNLHFYEANWDPRRWLQEYTPRDMHSRPVVHNPVRVPLAHGDGTRFDDVLPRFVDFHGSNKTTYRTWSEPFFDLVAEPMLHAFHSYKRGEYDAALIMVDSVMDTAWRQAGQDWLQAKIKARREKTQPKEE